MIKKYNSAPLPFQGQKRRFVRQIEEMAESQSDEAIFVDLFGGSGLISHTIKRVRPGCRVVYNDYDHYSDRLALVDSTNAILRSMRDILSTVPRKMRLDEPLHDIVMAELSRWSQKGAVDWLTISSNLLFTMKYAQSLDEMQKQTFYNRIRLDDYDVSGYLDGLEIVSMDYRQLFERFRLVSNVVFILDPPYLSTDCGSYQCGYWRLSDYLDVLTCLRGTRFVYFTSNRSSIIELANWISKNKFDGNPFDGAIEHRSHVSGQALNYDDIMLIKTAA